MFSHLWPPVPEDDAPIGSVTNGVHSRSWVGGEMQELYERYLGPDWAEAPPDEWERVREVPDEEVWRARERAREALVAYARRRLRDQLLERGSTRSEVEWTDELFDPRTLTVGFARRFAEYKRATLLLSDADRLRRLLTDQARPVQLIYAGKSHPHDDLGKELIRRIVHFGGEHDVRTRVVFLEDYDISLARQLYQGVDVWLNNPRRPLEACGTSGMKAALNGALNLSVLDGWWAEMYNGENGWAIGKAEEYTDTGYQDQVEASALYDLLERHVTPAFYDREGRVPRAWVARVKESIVSLGPQVRASRMMKDYVESMYEPVARQRRRLADGDFLRAKTLSEWKARVRQAWPHVSVKRVDSEGLPTGVVGGDVTLRVLVDLGDLTPGDVTVQLAHGVVDRNGDLISPAVEPVPASGTDGGEHLFETSFVCQSAGLYGFAVRVVPSHDDLLDPHETGLVAWAT
jgi:starch phosphorylase